MKKCHYSKMIRILKYCLCAIILCSAIEAYGVWNKVGQFSTAASCGYFFDADNGIIGLGLFGSFRNSYVGTDPLAIFWTNDGGRSWTPSAIPPKGKGRVTSIFMKDRLEGYASLVADIYSLWQTTDGGKSWHDFTQGNNDLTTSVYATSTALIKTMWGGTQGGSSTNGGRSYSSVFSGGAGDQSNGIDFVDDKTGVVTIGPSGGSVWLTSDGGVNWRQGGDLAESWSVYGAKGTKMFFTLSEDAAFNPGQTVYWSQNSGQNWSTRSRFNGSPSFTGHITGVGNTLYVQTDLNENQGLYRSDDLGASWINVGGPSNMRDTRFVVTGCRGEVVYAFDDQGGVWKTTDGGNGAFSLTPRVGSIPGGKAGDSVNIPIYLDSSAAPFTINQFSGNLSLNTDLLSPVSLDTIGTLSQSVIWDTLYKATDGSIAFTIKYKTPLKNGIAFSKPIIYIKSLVYVTKTDTTTVTLNSLDINSGATQKPLVVCTSTSNLFTITNECGDSTLRSFMVTGNIAKLLSINPNPSSSNSVEMHIYLPSESDLSLDILDENGKYRYSGIAYGRFSKGEQNLKIGIAALGNGIYYLRLHVNSGSYLTGSVVITR